MPRKLIKRYLPDHRRFREHKHLKRFGRLLHDPNIWHLNRRSVSGAFFVGLLCAWIPVPFQMVIAAAIAIAARVNLPISVILVWITNPLTMAPMFYYAHKLGAWILDSPPHKFSFELSFNWFMSELGHFWQPFLLGCLLIGLLSALTGYVAAQVVWRVHIFQYIKKRSARRRQGKETS
ncbi:hypothetical protein Tel_09710 [Candidatus Tenderia electrophaga]|jgi:hypothetical protein|uniref:DUF2062 domain-containing protein n=1 Tax=Candidatus Tenderia electrophaga TaxID=1748243 RepID=A0A0S2TE22_9GAMM|nr:hypothetical protein Tel_09710 [Candidatus Tenderia electrophaga]